MGSGISKARSTGSSSSSSNSTTSFSSSSSSLVKNWRLKIRRVFSSTRFESSSRNSDDDQVSDHHGEASTTALRESEPDSAQSSNISSRILSRSSFVPGSFSIILRSAASVGSSRAYSSSPTSATNSNVEEDHLINNNESRNNSSVNSSCVTSASVRSHDDSSVNLQQPASSTLSDSLQDDQVISSQDLSNHDIDRAASDACLPSVDSQMDMEGLNRRFVDRRYGARLRDRFVRRPSYLDLILSLQQEISSISIVNSANFLIASNSIPISPIIWGIVMRAEALFQRTMMLFSRPSLSPLGVVPAPKEVVDTLPVKSYIKSTHFQDEEVAQCSICFLEYEEGEDIRILPCHHEFHKECIDKWLKEFHRVCPLCRGGIYRTWFIF